MDRIRSAGPARHQIVARPVHELCDDSVGRCDVAYQNALMVLSPPLEHRGDERDAETGAPVSAEIRQTRSFVVLVRGQIRVRELAYRYEHECVTETLKASRQRKVEVVSLRREPAEIQEREGRDREACAEHAGHADLRYGSHPEWGEQRYHGRPR